MRQHIVAELLAVPQPRAMAEHQPGMRTQHGDMVGDRLRIGRTDADIHHGDAGAEAALQMIGRHLRQARRRAARDRLDRTGGRHEIAGLDEGVIPPAPLGHQAARAGAELVDIELVVGEQHEVLEMLGIRRGVMREAEERIIDARRRERGERHGRAGRRHIGAVDDGVIRHGEVGHVEHVAQRTLDPRRELALDMNAVREGEMQWDRQVGRADRDRNAVIAQQQADLLRQIAAEEAWLGDRGRILARTRDMAIGEAGIDMGVAARPDADLRISGAHPALRQRAMQQRIEAIAQMRRMRVIDLLEAPHRLHRIGEGLGGDRLRKVVGDGVVIRLGGHVGPHLGRDCPSGGAPGQGAPPVRPVTSACRRSVPHSRP